MTKADKERIVQLCTQWRERSGLNIPRIVARIQTYGVDIDRDQFNSRFVRLDRTPDIEPELILAVVAAFAKDLAKNERCTPEEAIDFANLTRLPSNQFDELKSYFSESEFQQVNECSSTVIQKRDLEGQEARTTSHNESAIESSYKTYLQQEYGYLPLGGIAPRIQNRVLNFSIEDLYTPARVEQDAPLQSTFIMGGVKGFEALRTTDPRIVGMEEMHAYSRVVVLGEPGSGKSTLLRWHVNQLLKESNGSNSNTLPIFIRLTHFGLALESSPRLSLAKFIEEFHQPRFSTLFTSFLKGQGTLLLDGLDEIADPSIRRLARDAMQTFAAQFVNIRMVVSSRIVGYRNIQFFGEFQHFTLQPFGMDEISRFIYNWHFTVSRQAEGISINREKVEDRINRLIEDIQAKPQVRQLAGTPLLLTIITLMDWQGKDIPRRRVELYREAIRTLLEDWPIEHQRTKADDLDFDIKLNILARLSFYMFENGLNDSIHENQLESLLVEQLITLDVCNESEVKGVMQRWLTFLSEQSGLLLKSGTDDFSRPVYSFLHLSFVEYLCGRELGQLWKKEQIDLSNYINRPKWREVILLMAGEIGIDSREDTGRLIDEIYNTQPPYHDVLHQSLVLAAGCLADDIQITADAGTKILTELVTSWHSRVTGLLRSKLFRILAAMRGTNYAPEVIVLLMSLVCDQQEWVRCSVLELLGKLGQPSDIAIKKCLISALSDSNVNVQHAAIRSIESLKLAQIPEIRASLLEIFKNHPKPKIRSRAALALRCTLERDTTSQDVLLQALEIEENDEVRQLVARVLSVVKQPDPNMLKRLFQALCTGKGGVDKEAATTFISWGNRGKNFLLTELTTVLKISDDKTSEHILRIIASVHLTLGKEGVDLLLKTAETEERIPVRTAAIRALGDLETSDERVLKLLLDSLTDSNRITRQYAARGLKKGFIQNQKTAHALAYSLETDHYYVVRMDAAEALGNCGHQDDIITNALESALTDENDFVCLFAAVSLIKLDVHSPKAMEQLYQSLGSKNGEIRQRTAFESKYIIHRLELPLIAVLIELVEDDNRQVREQAIRTLGELGSTADENVLHTVQKALEDEYHRIRVRAAEALEKFGRTDQSILETLLHSLTDPNSQVRLAASTTLMRLGEGEAYEFVVVRVRKLLDSTSPPDDVLNTLWGLVVGE